MAGLLVDELHRALCAVIEGQRGTRITMLVLNVKLQVSPLAILLWAQLTLESHLINATALRMPPQVIGPGEVLGT